MFYHTLRKLHVDSCCMNAVM